MANSKSGKILNPRTNRYHKLTSRKGKALAVPCKAGYSRNPATNRCKKSLKACKEGSSRNSVTKRCRKN